MNATDIVLWSVQGFLSVFFLAVGAPKVIGQGLERWTGFADLPRPLVILIGGTEVLGAAGLVLPMAMGIMPWLTPLAALGLAVTVLMAAGFHLRADERLAALETVLWAGLAVVVAVGRFHLLVGTARVPGWTLISAVGLLFPAAIVNIVLLWRTSSPSRTAAPAAAPEQHHMRG